MVEVERVVSQYPFFLSFYLGTWPPRHTQTTVPLFLWCIWIFMLVGFKWKCYGQTFIHCPGYTCYGGLGSSHWLGQGKPPDQPGSQDDLCVKTFWTHPGLFHKSEMNFLMSLRSSRVASIPHTAIVQRCSRKGVEPRVREAQVQGPHTRHVLPNLLSSK